MADLSITPADVISQSGSVRENGTGGATITAGNVVYKDSADSEYKLADADSTTAALRSPRGIALNGCADGQPLQIHREGDINLGAVLTEGVSYYLSATAGGICPYDDLVAGDYPVFIGIAKSTSILSVKFAESGVELPA